MSTTTFRSTYGPILVSELPPVTLAAPASKGLLARLGRELTLRQQTRRLNRAIDNASQSERGDLLALSRRG
jgi:hypothetical protein